MRSFILCSLLFVSVLAFHLQKNEFLDEEYLTRTVRSADDSSSSSEEKSEKSQPEGSKVESDKSVEASGDKAEEKQEEEDDDNDEGSGARFVRETEEGSGGKSSSSEENDEDEASGERFVRDVEVAEGSGEDVTSQKVAIIDEDGSGEGADETFFKEPPTFF